MSHTFTLWAPLAEQVDCVAAHHPQAMERVDHGWWRCTVADAGPGTRYRFAVDGSPPLADPRSPSQPLGVSGPSEVVDHGAFAWGDRGWRGLPLAGAVLYELHVGTFTAAGTFDAVIERLPHLVELGIDAIELLPVAEFSGDRGWGYDGVYLFAPHHAYGGPDGLRRLVDAAHGAGIGVVMDVVYNHFGPQGGDICRFGPYLTDRHTTNWGDAVNFDDAGSDEVRAFVVDNALMWLRDYHCDGLRLDAVHAIVDQSATHVLEQLGGAVDALAAHVRRHLFLIAESDRNDPRLVHSRDAGGYGLDAAWADDWHHALHAVMTGDESGYYADFGPLTMLAKALRQAWVYDGSWSAHRRRVHGRRPTAISGGQLVVSTQNHDQVGNRALGERLGALTTTGRLKVAAALLLTGPFTPMLFQGEEWAAATAFQYFTHHDDPDLGRAVCQGRRQEFADFGWDPDTVPDPQDVATFERSKLDWSELSSPPHDAMLAWYRDLIALRRRVPALSDPRLDAVEVACDEAAGWLTVRRGPITVMASVAATELRLDLAGVMRVVLASAPSVRLHARALALPPDSVAILQQTGP
ncbi:MAG TPA: malto-oligosyltrehalose trehalohydrolase [Candidatus Micrarchaeia archaeon]|nr:malto-oligosyltrehalose trehalohydrolase [Candidatus Micrarchaeia archaeon]